MEINEDREHNYDSNLIEIRTSMLQSHLFDYISAYILIKRTVTAAGAGIVMCN